MNNQVLLSFVNILFGIVSRTKASPQDYREKVTFLNTRLSAHRLDIRFMHVVQCSRRNKKMFISLEFLSSKRYAGNRHIL